MKYLVDYPLVLFAVAFPALWLASAAGGWLRMRDGSGGRGRAKGFDLIGGAILSLLALLIGFTFSMASSRYDQRKNLEGIEANAIGTELQRAQLLPPPDAARVRDLLRAYTEQRVLFFENLGDAQTLARINRTTDQLEGQLWDAVKGPAIAQPNPLTVLVVSSMNEVLDARGYTQAAIWNRVPKAAWYLMTIIALWSSVLIGYGAIDSRSWRRLGLAMPLAISVSFLLIADIDCPQHGLIRLQPENLKGIAQSFGH